MRKALHGLLLVVGLQLCLIGGADAKPLHYRLDTAHSIVGFEVDFGNIIIRGQMPVASADLTLDFHRVAASKVSVTLNADAARANIPFATEAMRGANVLATRQYPEISFASTAVSATATGAKVVGNITIRGMTRPVTLGAQLFRAAGTSAGERDNLTILLTGTVSRAAFGATGFSDMVGDTVRLKILARIRRDK